MARSKKKLPFISYALLLKVRKWKAAGGTGQLKTWSRRSVIYPEFIGVVFHVHNGKTFLAVSVTENMVGHKLGEFVATRKLPKHRFEKKD